MSSTFAIIWFFIFPFHSGFSTCWRRFFGFAKEVAPIRQIPWWKYARIHARKIFTGTCASLDLIFGMALDTFAEKWSISGIGKMTFYSYKRSEQGRVLQCDEAARPDNKQWGYYIFISKKTMSAGRSSALRIEWMYGSLFASGLSAMCLDFLESQSSVTNSFHCFAMGGTVSII